MKVFAQKIEMIYLRLLVFVAGASILIIEIAGTRIVSPFYGSTIYVWSSLISVTMAALATGYWFGGKAIDKYPEVRICVLSMFSASALVFLIPETAPLVLKTTDVLGIKGGVLAATAALYFLPLLFLGAISSMAVKLEAASLAKLGETAGKVYAWATAGSLAGALVTGFYLAPQLDTSMIFYVLSFVLGAISAAGLFLSGGKMRTFYILSAYTAFIMTIAYLPDTFEQKKGFVYEEAKPVLSVKARDQVNNIGGVVYPTIFTSKGSLEARVIYREPSQYGDITVFDYADGTVRCFLIAGANESCWNFQKHTASEYVDDIRYFLDNAPAKIDNLLVIGFGAGTLLKELDGAQYEIDAVEINPKMLSVAENFFGLPDNLDFSVYIEDGRNFLSRTEKKYDAIVLDICNVNQYNAHLWTLEFYDLLKDRLQNPQTGLVVASRGVVHDLKTERLDHMIANAMEASFENLLYTQRVFEKNEYDVAVFAATSGKFGPFSDRQGPKPKVWHFDPTISPTTDARLDEAVDLFFPATESIVRQTRENFGRAILLPLP